MLQEYSVDQKEKWNSIVTSFENYDVFYLNEYVQAFKNHGDGEPVLFYYEDDSLRGINVVMKRDIANDKHFVGKLEHGKLFDFSTPYGYGGWITEGNGEIEPLSKEYIDWCKTNGIICEFVRFSLFSNTREAYYGTVVPRTNNVVCFLDKSIEEMFSVFEHKVRKNYRKAEKFGLEIQVVEEDSSIEDFLRIYYSTMDRNDAEGEYYFKEDFFRTINEMNGHFAYFNVLLDGKVISTELVIIGSDTMYSYLGGTDSNYFDYRPNDFLKVKIIEWGIEKGFKKFVLGGGYGSDDGIFRYKKSFSPEGIIQFYTGQYIFNEVLYNKLVSERVVDEETKFFPKYRA